LRRALSLAARDYGDGHLHLTTRQDVQVHGVALDYLCHVAGELQDADVLILGGGGNALRNIIACSDAGVCNCEPFDVTPYALALTETMLRDPRSCQLPRKYKIAFSGCVRDCAGATVNDLGLIAQVREGVPGFSVYVGGGMGAISRAATLLEAFVPAHELHFVAEAVKRIFDKHGNRENRHKARLRFLLQERGMPWFRERYDEEMAALRLASAPLKIRVTPVPAGCDAIAPPTADETFAQWQRLCVVAQKQTGYFRVTIPVALGDISADVLERLAGVADRYGERLLRAAQSQNFVLRWVAADTMPALYAELKTLGLAGIEPPILQNLVACVGPAICNLGICQSPELARALREQILASNGDWTALGDFRIHISGCMNACGRHPVADIALFGVKRRIGDLAVLHYVLQLGGRLGDQQTCLAEGKQAVRAENVPDLIVALLEAFLQSAARPVFHAFLKQDGRAVVDRLITQHGVDPA
jgi:sulfite reductase (ferredoxin)